MSRFNARSQKKTRGRRSGVRGRARWSFLANLSRYRTLARRKRRRMYRPRIPRTERIFPIGLGTLLIRRRPNGVRSYAAASYRAGEPLRVTVDSTDFIAIDP